MIKDLPEPLVNARLNGEEADFHWPDRKLAVEVDGRTRRPNQRTAQEARGGAAACATSITEPWPRQFPSHELKGSNMKKIKILATSAALTLP